MGLFKRKPDPITERAKLLNNQIAALESEIKKLATQKKPVTSVPVEKDSAHPAPAPFTPVRSGQPRLRSTALPPGQAAPAPLPQEPIFEEVGPNRIQHDVEPPAPAHFNDLGVRKYDLASAWRRVRNYFRGPVTSNPKLVHYLSAGSVQGLRPLRYEKRVARNRFLLFAAILLGMLWGVLAIILRNR